MTRRDESKTTEDRLHSKSEKALAGGGESGAGKKPKKDFEIDIFRGWCKSCGICAAFCPRECIKLDEEGSPVIEEALRCTGCGWCELHCPDFAISVRPKKVKAIRQEED